MRVGDASMRITGIGGDLMYMGNSMFRIRDKDSGDLEERKIDRVGMVAAGSGITPMFQVSHIFQFTPYLTFV